MKLKWLWLVVAVPLSVFAANELTLNTTFLYSKNGASMQNNQQHNITVTGTPTSSGVITITNSAPTAIPWSTVTSNGWVFLKNLTTNALSVAQFGVTTNEYHLRLLGGESTVFRINGAALYGLSVTNGLDIQFIILSE